MPPGDAPREYAAKSLGLTERWLDRCFNQYHRTSPKYGHYQALFPIVQGCTYPDLRARAAENVKQYDADGYAIGGLAVGEPTEVMYEMIEVVNAILPEDRPRYLMGVGTPVNILEGIERGVDMFDCVMPTRNGRNGQLFTAEGVINIRNKKWRTTSRPSTPRARPSSTGSTRRPTCTTSASAARCSLPRSPRCTTSPSTCGSWERRASTSSPGLQGVEGGNGRKTDTKTVKGLFRTT